MTAFLFPGQGSQKPGMGQDFVEASGAARVVFDRAATAGPEGFLDQVFHGGAAWLTDTRNAQPALLVVEVAIAEHLRGAGLAPSVCTGHSLGEIPALVVSGALDFEDALPLTFERGRLMAEDVPPGGMAAVMGLEADAIEAALPEDVQVANYNGPGQTIISGSAAGIEQAQEMLKAAGAKRVLPLKVSGPFHSKYMAPAAEAFQKLLAPLPLREPAIRFVSSVSGKEESDPGRIRDLLGRQLTEPVRWTDVMGSLQAARAVEVGPGNVLKGLAKRIGGAPEVASAGTLDEANEALA